MTLEKELEEIESKRATILSKIQNKKSGLKFQCGCGKLHAIKECVVVQTHWYTPAHGCTGGDYWNDGELQIVCPNTQLRNRVMFERTTEQHFNRDKYDYNAEAQFSREYKRLFSKVVDEHDRDSGCSRAYTWCNNYYIDKNHKKFGLKTKVG